MKILNNLKFNLMAAMSIFGLAAVSTPVYAVDGCKAILCFAAPNPTGIAECKGLVREVLRDMARGKPFPTCSMISSSDTYGSNNIQTNTTSLNPFGSFAHGWGDMAIKININGEPKIFVVEARSLEAKQRAAATMAKEQNMEEWRAFSALENTRFYKDKEVDKYVKQWRDETYTFYDGESYLQKVNSDPKATPFMKAMAQSQYDKLLNGE